MARPRGINLNPQAVRDLARLRGLPLKTVAEQAEIVESHLQAALHEAKGLSRDGVERLAKVLQCGPETIAPSLSNLFLAIRPKDAA